MIASGVATRKGPGDFTGPFAARAPTVNAGKLDAGSFC